MELSSRILKDCLLEDSNSSSSNGFKSIPRRPPHLDTFPKRKQSNLLKAVINAVKNLRSSSVKSSSLSRQLSSKNKASITVIRVKDIVRWNSSKELHEDTSHLELSPPHQYTTTTGVTTCSSTTIGTSCSSWCESEFLLSSYGSNLEECGEKECGKNNLRCVSEDSCPAAVTVADTEVGPEFENEYKRRVSVFEIQKEEDDDDEASNSSFSQCLDNVERTKEKLMQTIQRFETLANIIPFSFDELVSMDEEEQETDIKFDDENCDTIEDEDVEEKATQLWKRVKERHAIWIHEEHLIMDYFRDELMMQGKNSFRDIQHFENKLVGEAKGWLQGQSEPELEHGTSEERRCACVREIERRNWNEKKMKEEHEEMVLQIEDGIFKLLMNETLTSLCELLLIPLT